MAALVNALNDALEFAVCTDQGMVRSNNEDSVFVDPSLGLAIVADGMGGASAGEVASGMATTRLATDLKQALARRRPADVAGTLRETIAVANDSIFRAAKHQPQYSGMGTTLVVTLFHDNRVTVAHVGDSRLYRFRAGDLMQLTRDHSLLQLRIDSGLLTAEEARQSTNKNIVTRALGLESQVEPEIHEHRAWPGDIYVLCSDGLHDMVGEEDIARVLREAEAKLESAATQLVRMANNHGGRDNISVILVRVVADFATPNGWWRRLLAWLK